ncbi:hypothetical protein [Variovorax saccharolyticus]|uniref:hypothetical protein n=1 Tax=Variovorax saccharolyticus TaxID=3053516 RepID=UPI0025791C6C|nr:hypothetical protein [Variovorax sp. J22R187]MDM0019492.1 hypothetical protein [Variovorax sp. J22R187]
MRLLLSTCALAGAQIIAFTAHAQTQPIDNAVTRAERRVEGVEAARTFMPGEGDPIPEPKARVSKAERAAARQARKPQAVEAARTFTPGEGDPIPTPTTKLSRAERSAGRKASRSELAKANRAGQLPSYSDNYGGN